MFVRDIYTRLRQAIGNCDEARVFDYTTDALTMLQNKGRFDAGVADVDLCVCASFVTLPRDVKTVLGVTTNGRPNYLTDSWASYHLNGAGYQDCVDCDYSQVAGTFCTFRDPSEPVYLVAELESAADNDTPLRVYAETHDGKPVYTPNPETGVMEEGFLVPTVYGYSVRAANVPAITRIYRISKRVTQGRVKLLAVNNDSTLSPHTLIGEYAPSETDPSYQRIKVPVKTWVRVRYQKKDYKIRSLDDWINIDNAQALILAVKAVRFRYEDKWDEAARYEAEATRLLSEEQRSRQPASNILAQVVVSDTWNYSRQQPGMFY